MADAQRINQLIELFGVSDSPIPDGQIRRELQEASKEAVPQLLEALNHSNPKVRSGSASVLGMIADERSVESLIAALSDDDEEARESAVLALMNIGDRRAIEPLLSLLQEDKAYFVVTALARFGDSEFIEPIIASLYAKAEKRMQLGDEDMHQPLRRADFFSRPHIRALATFNNPHVIPPLIEAISSQDIKVFDPAFYGLKEIGADAVQPLIDAFDQPTADRSRIVWLLGEIGDLRAFDLIIEALYDPYNEVQHDAIVALRDLKDPHAIPPLLEYLSHLPPEEKWAITTTKKVLEELGYKGNGS